MNLLCLKTDLREISFIYDGRLKFCYESLYTSSEERRIQSVNETQSLPSN